MHKLLILLGLLLACRASAGYNGSLEQQQQQQAQLKDCRNDYSLDYLKLSLQWSSGVCATSAEDCDRGANVNNFTIHGLWPCQNSNPMEPHYCCFDQRFDYEALEPILPQLRRYWYAYFGTDESSSDRQFWAHEWTKHGTCARDIAALHGELSYFKTTLDTFLRLDIVNTLAKAKIVPSNSVKYDSNNIIDAIKAIHGGKRIEIECRFKHNNPKPDVTALDFCFNSKLEPVDCPISENRCRDQVIFPSSS